MNEIISTKELITLIFHIRGAKVMLDFHEVETRVLKQQVKRRNRIPGLLPKASFEGVL